MTDEKKAGRPGNSKTAKRTKNAHAGWGGPTREYASYVFVWFAGLAVGAWLF